MTEAPKIYPFKREGAAAKAAPQKQKTDQRLRRHPGGYYFRLLAAAAALVLLSRAQILGGLYPFAPACMAAVAVVYPKKGALALPPILIGLFTVLTGRYLAVYSAVVVLLAVVFLLYSVDGKKQWFVVPGMVIAATLVSKGLFIALTAYTDYQLLIAVFESIIAAGLALIFMVVISALRRFDVARRFSADETVCVFLAAMGLLCGLSGLTLGAVDVQGLASRLLVMMVAFLGGAGPGAAIGALVGVVPSLAQVVTPAAIATYCFSGLLAGVFGSFGRLGTAIGFIMGHMILALYILTAAEISAGLIASGLAAALFLLVPGKLYRRLGQAFSSSGLKSAEDEKYQRLLRMAVRKLRNCGWTFKDLSSSMAQLGSEDKVSEEANVRAAMEQLSHQLCTSCSMRDICWEIDYHDTFKGVVKLFDCVRNNGLSTVKDAPENFARRCPHIRELVAIVNCLYDLYCRSNYWQLQRISSRNLIGLQMAGVSEVLEQIANEITEFGEEREILERELQRSMVRRGMAVESAGIATVSDKAIDAWVQYLDCPGEEYCRQAIEDETGRLLGCRFTVHEHTCGGANCAGKCTYRLLAAGAHRFSVGQAQLSKNGKDNCGDSGGSIMLDQGRQMLLVSDGMGVGAAAARESGEAISLLSRLVEAGFRQDTAIDVVNAALSLRGEAESFVTLDMCIVDLYTGTADFIKTGASVSFIKRGGAVKVIKGSSLPMGMLYNVDKEVVTEQMLPGDMIILASDGLLETSLDDDGQWLSRIIEQSVAATPQALAEYLLDSVISVSHGRIRDDITVLVAKMGEVA